MSDRLPPGPRERIDRDRTVNFTFDGKQVSGFAGDTIGSTTPLRVQRLVERLLKHVPEPALALHFHDTRGMGMANVVAGLDMGITTFDSSLGGLGGCPYAPGATGNIASEDLLYLLSELGVESGINLDKVIAASREIAGVLNRELPSRYLRSHLAKVLRV